MKIYEFCMYHNEQPALDIKQAEAGRWVDELHLCEANATFKNTPRSPVLGAETDFLKPHLFDAARHFHPARQWGISRHAPFFRKKPMARKNETKQRNQVHQALAHVADDDIVILSDIDEIIDARHADLIIGAARQHGIVSIRMHHTLFYLNLYSTNWHEIWPGSPPDYAYRTFIMTGAHFQRLKQGSDHLRRQGEWGQLAGQVTLLEPMLGFHHSWLGDEKAALDKLQSYAHSLGEHRRELTDGNGAISLEKLRDLIVSGQSLFEGNDLKIRSFQDIPPLQSVMENLDKYAHLML